LHIPVGHFRLDHIDEGTMAAPTFELKYDADITRKNAMDRPWIIEKCMVVDNESLQLRVNAIDGRDGVKKMTFRRLLAHVVRPRDAAFS
jgi:hypothetical protein